MDVKYVPNECKSRHIPEDKKFYQYTYIDEATRERYLKRSNNIPMAVLGYLTPKEKRNKLKVFEIISYAV